jgi:PBS lyase HEAT-like repeat
MSEIDNAQIQIRCPDCGQRFKVGPELKGRMVECGACEYKFRVDDDSLIRHRKTYPGEKRDASLAQFSRSPHNVAAPQYMPTAQYAHAPSPEFYEPVSFARILVGVVGGAVMAFMLLILIVGGSNGGTLYGVTTNQRLILAAFSAVVGTAMILYANPRTRGKAILFSSIGFLTLTLAPFYFTEGSRAVVGTNPIEMHPEQTPQPQKNDERKKIADLKEACGYGPMEAALLVSGSSEKVLGLWLRGLQESNSNMVFNYLMRVSGAAMESHMYPRIDRNFLVVLVNVQCSQEELEQHCKRIGEVEQSIAEISLLDVSVNNALFAERPLNKLSDKTDSSFYQANYMELEGIDLKRINDALRRLAIAEPKQFRADIIRRMRELLPECDKEMLENLSMAFAVWSDGKDGAVEDLAKVALDYYKKNLDIPQETVQFLTKWSHPAIYPILDEMWLNDPTQWEETYTKAGVLGEVLITKHLTEGTNNIRMSAARILARIGTEKAIDQLQEAMEKIQDAEVKTSFQQAIDAINERGN